MTFNKIKQFLLMSILLIPSWLLASEPVEAAEYAVRQLIRSKLGSDIRVAFDEHSEGFLSMSEEVVTGKGHVYRGDDWQFDRSFEYRVKVYLDGSRTRDLVVTFTNGERHTDTGDWKKSGHTEDAVHVTSPRWYQKLDSGRVVFEGTAPSEVTVTVFDRSNNRVASRKAVPVAGRFKLDLNLPEGNYRALITTRREELSDEVRFSVNGRNDDWGHPAAYLNVGEPRRNARVMSSRVTFSGNSSDRSVWLQVWDSRNNRVVDRDIPVRDRYWNSQVELEDGSYRFTVRSGTSLETRDFTVDTGRWKPGKPSNEASLSVSSPRSNENLTQTRVTFSGNSSERSVRLQVWDSRNNRVLSREIPVRNGYWNSQAVLDEDSYRFTVTSGSRSESRNFRVTSRQSSSLRVTLPLRYGVVKGPMVAISGDSTERAVTVQVFDERYNRIFERRVSTFRDKFSTVANLKPGRYRIRVSTQDLKKMDEFMITVK